MTRYSDGPRQRPSGDPEAPAPRPPFPVVGIGASAGGLDAFKRFLSNMPADSGMAFVLIPHLDPTHESLMVELLAKQTPMPVQEAADGSPLHPNQVYIIPPSKYLSVSDGALRLQDPPEPRGRQTAIDHFLRALAEAYGEMAVGIVLSGTGAHGTLGLREIKGQGGLTLVQAPDTAAYAQMPESAIATGLIDYVLPVEEMPEALVTYWEHLPDGEAAEAAPSVDQDTDQLTRVLTLLRARTQYDFRCYRKNMILRRVRRRMGLCQVTRISEYLERLRADPEQVTLLFKDLLIGVTSFFREPDAFEILEQRVIGPLVERKDREAPLRVWVPGCATGEEAYSIAMLLIESFGKGTRPCRFQIFATDIDEEALDFARQGVYPESIVTDLAPERLARFFVAAGDHHYQVNKQLRESVVFAAQNLIGDAPFSRLDLISCRNLLIYLEPDVQRKVITLFHFALNPDGYLFLGPSETVGKHVDLFETVSKKWRVFRRIGPTRRDIVEFPIVNAGEQRRSPPGSHHQASAAHLDFADLTQRLLLDAYAPASLLINRRYEILYFHGPTVRYLELPTGEPTRDLTAMTRPGLRTKLRAACHMAVRENRPITVEKARVTRDGAHYPVTMTVTPVTEPRSAEGLLLVTFADRPETATDAPERNADAVEDATAVQHLEYELKTTREDLQSTIEEMESSNEELKASNEEVMSMNEELQSANEELETSKEELQSLNEELSTVNNQLQDKVEELERANNDITNLLDSTDIGTIFLDTALRIKRFTPATSELLPLLVTDIGRPFSDFSLKLDDDSLLADAARVLKDLSPAEREVSGPGGRHYLRRIRPYRTRDHRIEGVMLTFVDVTERVAASAQSRRLAAVLLASGDAITVADLAGRITAWNRGAARMFGYTEAEAQRMKVDDLIPPGAREESAAIRQRIAAGEQIEAYESRRLTKDGRVLDVGVTATRLADESGRCVAIATTERDITRRKQMEAQLQSLNRDLEQRTAELQRSKQEFQTLADNVPALFSYIDTGERYRYANPRCAALVGRAVPDLIGRPLEEICGPEFYERVCPHIKQALSGHEVHFELEIEVSGDTHVFQATFMPDTSNDGRVKGFFILANDITERKRAEQALLEKEQRLRAIVNTAADGIVSVDREGIVRDFNQAAETMFGYSAAAVAGMHIRQLIVPSNGKTSGAFPHGYRPSGGSRGGDARHEAIGHRKGGDPFPLELSVSEVDHLGLYVCLLRDVSDRKALEREVIEMGTLEQERIGREIHDGIGQQLTAVGMLATSLERRLVRAQRPEEAKVAGELAGHLREALDEAKSLARGLTPVEIGPEGLVDALSVLVERAEACSGVRCRLSVSGKIEAVDKLAAVHLYRIAQEALNNAMKHANADRIEVRVQHANHRIVLSVRDNGVGIGPMEERKGRLGLQIMRYRAGIMGASLVVQLRARGGTEVKCLLPVRS